MRSGYQTRGYTWQRNLPQVKASMTKKMAKKVSFGKSFKNCIQDYECLLETALVIFRIIDIFTDLVGALLSDDWKYIWWPCSVRPEDLAIKIAQAYGIQGSKAILLRWNLNVSKAFVEPPAFYNTQLQAIPKAASETFQLLTVWQGILKKSRFKYTRKKTHIYSWDQWIIQVLYHLFSPRSVYFPGLSSCEGWRLDSETKCFLVKFH